MPAATGTKRVKLIQISRPFVFGSVARPIDPNNRSKDTPDDHTHEWTIFVKGVNNVDISYWLKKVQFKLHETYANALRPVENPPFQITETGWGEFDVGIKLYFVPEACEKPGMIWHMLKLHPFGDDAEGQRERREVISQTYTEVQFNEPTVQLYDIMTGGGSTTTPKGKGGKGGKSGGPSSRTAELPATGNPYSRDAEGREKDRLILARKTVEAQIEEERAVLEEKQKVSAKLKAELEPVDAAVVTKKK